MGIVLLTAFGWRALRHTRTPLFNLRLFAIGSFTASTVVIIAAGFATYAGTLLMPLYYQQLRGDTALMAGIALIPQGVGSLATRSLSGVMFDKTGPRWVIVGGTLLTILATVPFAYATATTPSTWLIAALAIRGAGLGAIMIPAMGSAFTDVPSPELPSANIITRTVQLVAQPDVDGSALIEH